MIGTTFTKPTFEFKIMTGGLPFMTRGPFAMFFGGQDVLPDLSDRKAGRHIQMLYLVSIIFNLSIIRKENNSGKLHIIFTIFTQ